MNNRKGISIKNRILIDTSFLLPALGIEVEKEVMDVIPLFRKLDVYYLEASLLEALWKSLKLIPRDKLSRIEIGIEAIRKTYKLLTPTATAYIEAMKIYYMGYRDFIDALNYASAKLSNMMFLTIDYSFIDFLEKHGYTVKGVVVTPRELREYLGTSQ